MFAVYVHNLDPVIFRLWGDMAIRWYGLAYLLAFVVGFLLLRHLARRKLWVLPPEKTGDFIAAAALFGVFLGGRLGYILLYHIPREGWGSIAADPMLVLRVMDGGMASHGGILGLVIFTWFYSRKHKVSWTGLGDGLCVVAPLGLLFGRIANFINGELYGRVANGVPWAVKFPASLAEEPRAIQEMAWQACASVDPAVMNARNLEELSALARHNPDLTEVLGQFLSPRHPSQIYEGLLEGVALFTILWWVRVKYPKAPHGLLTGLFFGLYAIFRIIAEQFRQPDAAWVVDGLITKGQFFSFFMFAFCAGFLIYAWKGRSGNVTAVAERR